MLFSKCKQKRRQAEALERARKRKQQKLTEQKELQKVFDWSTINNSTDVNHRG